MKVGFTLIEVLAATAILSAVAMVIIPITMRLGHQRVRLDQTHRARLLIDEMVLQQGVKPGERVGLADGWWMATDQLTARGVAGLAVPHSWLRIRICRGSPTAPEVLAERLVVRLEQR